MLKGVGTLTCMHLTIAYLFLQWESKQRGSAWVLLTSSWAGLILHGGNEGDCPLVIALVPLKCYTVKIYNFLIGCPLPRRKCLGALALSKTKHTGLTGCIRTINHVHANKELEKINL